MRDARIANDDIISNSNNNDKDHNKLTRNLTLNNVSSKIITGIVINVARRKKPKKYA